jgi:hypothetical protein
MNAFLSQIIFLARNGDGGSWTNILFIVGLAIFWAVSGILKATKANKAKQKGKEQLTRKPVFKTSDRARVGKPESFQKTAYKQMQHPPGRTPYRGEPKPQIQPPRRKIVRSQPAVQKLAIKKAPVVPIETIEMVEEPGLPQVQPEIQELPEYTSKTVKGLEAMRVRTPAEIDRTKYLAELLSDYTDPEGLRRAILHYEILGRPLSLRDPPGHIIGL